MPVHLILRKTARRGLGRVRERRLQQRLAGPKLLRAFARENPRATFIEVGSNDGMQHDPLRPILLKYPWRGVMVEPVPYVFDRLRENYAGRDGILLEKAAIADQTGELPFYHLREARGERVHELPSWYDGIGSFSREAVLGHSRHIPDIESRIVVTSVPCLTFEALCRKHDIRQIDLLLIDTEGYDREVIRNIDFGRWSPSLLVFEHYHLSESDWLAARAQLADAGYDFLAEGFDTWCLGPRATKAVREVWSSLAAAVPPVFAADEPHRKAALGS